MRLAAGGLAVCCGLLSAAAGCARNPYVLQGQLQQAQQAQVATSQRDAELTARATALDQDNQELEKTLAQSRQQSKLLEDQVALLREQLAGTTSQLTRLREDRDQVARKADELTASTKRKVGAMITANSSLGKGLPAKEIEGIEVRADGDVIRIELPGVRLFEPGGARLQAGAGQLIDSVADEVVRHYPQQTVGIEGYTDSDPIQASRWANNHQLSVGRAMAVYDYLVAQGRLKPRQLFVVGHGPNHPVVSNGTPAGKERNRRVELVIYPEKADAPAAAP